MRVAVPVTDLRSRPIAARGAWRHDPLQESQLLYGEEVLVKRRRGRWSEVEAIEQPEWSHRKRWEGYPGWVRSAHLQPPATDWRPNLTVTGKHAVILERPDPSAPVLLTLSLGSRIAGVEPIVANAQSWQEVLLVDGRLGWVPRSLVAATDELRDLDVADRRARLVEAARSMLGDPYYWGGRSATPHPMLLVMPPVSARMAVDCSGLVNLAHRAAGVDVPRDAHEQFLRCRRIHKDNLQVGDLVFLSEPDDPHTITHVMLYLGDEDLIEASGTGQTVRQITLAERLGFTRRGLQEDRPLADRRFVRFGTYLP